MVCILHVTDTTAAVCYINTDVYVFMVLCPPVGQMFGCGAVAQLVLSGGSHGMFLTVNFAFGFAATLGILVCGQVSGERQSCFFTCTLCVTLNAYTVLQRLNMAWIMTREQWLGQYKYVMYILKPTFKLLVYSLLLKYTVLFKCTFRRGTSHESMWCTGIAECCSGFEMEFKPLANSNAGWGTVVQPFRNGSWNIQQHKSIN